MILQMHSAYLGRGERRGKKIEECGGSLRNEWRM